MTLDQLALGEDARIVELEGRGPFRRRLMEFGLLPGTRIQRTGQAPLGDPLSFRARGAVFSLRKGDAAAVRIEHAR